MKETKKKRVRTYSRFTREATALLGQAIRVGRVQRRMTAQDLADRAGITRATLWKIENGDLSCEIGLVFEVATIVNVPLFDATPDSLVLERVRMADRLTLLPKSVRTTVRPVDDEF